MDFNKIKDFAKKATEKTADGLSSMNEMRKKAAQETKISFGTTTIRKTINGLYYTGFYSETPELFEFENFQFEGSAIIERTKTTGTTKQKGKKGSALLGAAIGSAINPVGTIVGSVIGASGKRKGKIDSTSVTTTEEKPGLAKLYLRNIETNEVKTIKAKITNAQAENIKLFFE
ncbi:hypothetical protein [Streptococcus sp. 400_SSPC]|uniref:hypothetical protein n=1 Tax=Streptococcus sp. 400_SSPC TaxID=1579341 RepID=UPI000660BDB7|nr:hypothetical protein [Streptococcus sp. 400_SSPC]